MDYSTYKRCELLKITRGLAFKYAELIGEEFPKKYSTENVKYRGVKKIQYLSMIEEYNKKIAEFQPVSEEIVEPEEEIKELETPIDIVDKKIEWEEFNKKGEFTIYPLLARKVAITVNKVKKLFPSIKAGELSHTLLSPIDYVNGSLYLSNPEDYHKAISMLWPVRDFVQLSSNPRNIKFKAMDDYDFGKINEITDEEKQRIIKIVNETWAIYSEHKPKTINATREGNIHATHNIILNRKEEAIIIKEYSLNRACAELPQYTREELKEAIDPTINCSLPFFAKCKNEEFERIAMNDQFKNSKKIRSKGDKYKTKILSFKPTRYKTNAKTKEDMIADIKLCDPSYIWNKDNMPILNSTLQDEINQLSKAKDEYMEEDYTCWGNKLKDGSTVDYNMLNMIANKWKQSLSNYWAFKKFVNRFVSACNDHPNHNEKVLNILDSICKKYKGYHEEDNWEHYYLAKKVKNGIAKLYKTINSSWTDKCFKRFANKSYSINLPEFKVINVNELDRDIIDPNKDAIICSKTSTGKTKATLHLLNNLPADKSVLWITHRCSLNDAIWGKIKDMNFVKYNETKSNPILANRILVQMESLSRVGIIDELNQARKFDIVILDESESLVCQATSNNFIDKTKAIAVLKYSVRYCHQLIMLDDDIDELSLSFYEKWRSSHRPDVECMKLLNTKKPYENRNILFVHNEGQLTYKIINAVFNEGWKVVIPTNSIAFARRIEMILKHFNETRKTNKTIKMFHGKNKHNHKEEIADFENIKCDVLIYTSTIDAGQSNEHHHFNAVFGYFTNFSTDHKSVNQMMHRIRNIPNTGAVYVKFCPQGLPDSRKEVETQLQTLNRAVHMKVPGCLEYLQYEFNEQGKAEFTNLDSYYHTVIDVIVHRNKSSNNFFRNLCKTWKTAGYKLTIDAYHKFPEIEKAICCAKKRVKDKMLKILVDAIPCDKEQSEDNPYGWEKQKIMKCYDMPKVDEEFVKQYGKKAVMNKYKICSIIADKGRVDALEELRQNDIKGKKEVIDINKTVLRWEGDVPITKRYNTRDLVVSKSSSKFMSYCQYPQTMLAYDILDALIPCPEYSFINPICCDEISRKELNSNAKMLAAHFEDIYVICNILMNKRKNRMKTKFTGDNLLKDVLSYFNPHLYKWLGVKIMSTDTHGSNFTVKQYHGFHKIPVIREQFAKEIAVNKLAAKKEFTIMDLLEIEEDECDVCKKQSNGKYCNDCIRIVSQLTGCDCINDDNDFCEKCIDVAIEKGFDWNTGMVS